MQRIQELCCVKCDLYWTDCDVHMATSLQGHTTCYCMKEKLVIAT